MTADDIEQGRRHSESGIHNPPPEVDDASSPDEEQDSDYKSGDSQPRRKQADLLVDMALAEYTLGVSETEEPFGVHRGMPHHALMLRNGRNGLRGNLARRFFALMTTTPSQQALADACMVLEGRALQAVPQRVDLRVADPGTGAVYIDMGDTAGRVIEIGYGKWKVVDTAPVLFRRTKLTGAMPHPHRPGNLAKLWEFVAVEEDDQPLILAWLVAVLIHFDVPHTILLLIAEQGSAKSSITRILVSLVDPSPVPLRKAPRDADSWVTAAAASWVVALDNLSGSLADWLSDSLCRASTGDGDVRRALYTDSDVSVLQFRRCPILNGVDLAIGQGDLAERVLPVDLKRPEHRRREDELAESWHKAKPHVLGGLLELAAQALARLPAVKVDDMPRMADFAAVLAAVDLVLGTRGLARYQERSKRIAADTLDDPFIGALVERRLNVTDKTSAEILAVLKPTSPDWKPPREWPKNARSVTGQLTRHAPALRAQGWRIDNDGGQNKAKATRWTITPPEKECEESPPDPPDPPAQVNAQKSGGSDEKLFPAADPPKPAGGLNGHEAGHDNLPNPPKSMPLNSDDGLAGQAGQDSGPSRVPRPDLCPRCTRVPARTDSGLCDYCTTRQQAIEAAQTRLGAES
jgi:hypothetical protein